MGCVASLRRVGFAFATMLFAHLPAALFPDVLTAVRLQSSSQVKRQDRDLREIVFYVVIEVIVGFVHVVAVLEGSTRVFM